MVNAAAQTGRHDGVSVHPEDKMIYWQAHEHHQFTSKREQQTGRREVPYSVLSHGEVEVGGYGEPPWQERCSRPASAMQGGASGLKWCVGARRRQQREELGWGAPTVANFASAARLDDGGTKEEKERSAGGAAPLTAEATREESPAPG
jgi:hypothetical protein